MTSDADRIAALAYAIQRVTDAEDTLRHRREALEALLRADADQREKKRIDLWAGRGYLRGAK